MQFPKVTSRDLYLEGDTYVSTVNPSVSLPINFTIFVWKFVVFMSYFEISNLVSVIVLDRKLVVMIAMLWYLLWMFGCALYNCYILNTVNVKQRLFD